MKTNNTAIIVVVLMLLVGVAHSSQAKQIHPSPPADTMISERICQFNSFTGYVLDCDNNPVPGEIVTLTYPNGSKKTDVTDSQGKFCFAEAISLPPGYGWEPGYYGLTTRCMGKLVYRDGDGDIEVDLSVCCPDPAGSR
jgi:hypothetical protein